MPREPGSTSIAEFHAKLQDSRRILALCGAGLSVASGLDTFRTPGGLWTNEQADELASPEKLETDPDLVWLFYSHRRHNGSQGGAKSRSLCSCRAGPEETRVPVSESERGW